MVVGAWDMFLPFLQLHISASYTSIEQQLQGVGGWHSESIKLLGEGKHAPCSRHLDLPPAVSVLQLPKALQGWWGSACPWIISPTG